jgi:release factor glutamine methyltransferase
VTPEAAPTIVTVLEAAEKRLRAAGVPDPRRDAAGLMAIVLGTDRGGVFARKFDALGECASNRFEALIISRILRKPMQYLTGHAEFRGLDFEVGPAVLIPRPETEGLVQAVLNASLPDDARIADLGTGSGCIAVSLAVERSSWRVVAVDLSSDALRIAACNAATHGVTDRVNAITRDFADVPDAERGVYDAVVSNPPYVPQAEWEGLQPEVRDHEPRLALVPGPTGNEAYEIVARAASLMLRPAGLLAMELGWKSEAAVREIVTAAGFCEISVRPDMQGIPRVLTARRPGSA